MFFLKDNEVPSGTEIDDVATEDIYREYVKMQRDIVSGRLICSKEEAATLVAVQLRLESWPDENPDLAEGEKFTFDYKIIEENLVEFHLDDELHTLSITLNDRTTGNGSITSPTWRDRHRRGMSQFYFSALTCCQRADANAHKSKSPCLPPNFRHSKEIYKLIKVNQTNIFLLRNNFFCSSS